MGSHLAAVTQQPLSDKTKQNKPKWLPHVPSPTSPTSQRFPDQLRAKESPELPGKLSQTSPPRTSTLRTKKMFRLRLVRKPPGKQRLLPEGFHSKSSKPKLPWRLRRWLLLPCQCCPLV